MMDGLDGVEGGAKQFRGEKRREGAEYQSAVPITINGTDGVERSTEYVDLLVRREEGREDTECPCAVPITIHSMDGVEGGAK